MQTLSKSSLHPPGVHFYITFLVGVIKDYYESGACHTPDGVVKAKARGKATITCEALDGSGLKVKCKIKVK